MVTRKHSKAAKKRAPAHSARSPQTIPSLTAEQQRKLAHYEQIMANVAEERATAAASKAARQKRENAERAGIRLAGERLRQARNVLADLHLAASAIHGLAFAAGGHVSSDAEPYLLGIESVAKVAALKADMLAALLGDSGFGHFQREFDAQAIRAKGGEPREQE